MLLGCCCAFFSVGILIGLNVDGGGMGRRMVFGSDWRWRSRRIRRSVGTDASSTLFGRVCVRMILCGSPR